MTFYEPVERMGFFESLGLRVGRLYKRDGIISRFLHEKPYIQKDSIIPLLLILGYLSQYEIEHLASDSFVILKDFPK